MGKKDNKSINEERYSIGLDIGVASVGWACMTSDFWVPRHNGRYAMGVREFETAETAEAQRIQRGTRIRYNRRMKRIQLLQQTLSPLFKKEPGFFIESEEKEKHFWRNSNHFENNSLSETLEYLGMNPRRYQTIYHLRNALMTKDEKFHPRLIYLALHNLVKYRGHFLHENMNWTDSEDAASLQILLLEYLKELTKYQYAERKLSDSNHGQVIDILKDKFITGADKRKYILDIIGKDLKEPVSLILGLKADVPKLFS